MSVALGPTDFNERDTTHFRWLRHTAAKSRSSAGNVTIFGQSAGATSVSYLMASPLAKGLFH